MSAQIYVDLAPFQTTVAARPAATPAQAVPRKAKYPWIDTAFVLPVLAAVLLIIGFGVVAAPLLLNDLPLLLR